MTKTPAIINLLHLSDVHFGCTDAYSDQGKIVAGIGETVAARFDKIDAVIFTGDLSQAAKPDEFQQGQDWLLEIAGQLKCPIILVPGNHDIDRTRAKIEILRTAYPGVEQFGLQKGTIYQNHDHVKPFLDWFKRAKDDQPALLNGWDGNPFIDTVSCSLAGIACKFICLNTAALSCDNEDSSKLCIDIGALNHALGTAPNIEELVVVVGHHPTLELSDWNKNKVNEILGQESGPHLYMHGHLHQDKLVASYAGTGAGIVTATAGAAYPGSRWAKVFSVFSIEFEHRQVTPSTFVYSDDSGKWHLDETRSRPIPARLPRVGVVVQQSVESNPLPEPRRWSNPFSVVMANGMPPAAVHRLFVDQNNSLTSLSNRSDTLIEGQRGTGKTMLLRYFSIEVQHSLASNVAANDLITHLNTNAIPVGVYCCLSNAGLNRSDFDAISSKDRRDVLFVHRLVLFLIGKLFESLVVVFSQIEKAGISIDRTKALAIRTLRAREDSTSLNSVSFARAVVDECNVLIQNIDEHVASILPGGSPTQFNPWLSLPTSFLSLVKVLKEELQLVQPFFFLLDDFDVLNAEQQSLVFKTAAIRNHDLICWKFGIMSSGQKSHMAGEGRTYREGDDYDLLELNWIDRGLEQDRGKASYTKTVEEICRRRMSDAGWPPELSFSTIFRPWEHGNKIREQVKGEVRKEYDALPVGSRPKTFDNFWSKQGDAKYFRYLRSKKIEHRYAGPATIIELSSGIFRQFLEICSDITNNALGAGWAPASGKKIGPEVQNSAIRQWSRDMFRSLGNSGDISSLSRRSFNVTSSHLVNFANGLSRFFSERLYSDSGDAEVIAVAIRGDFQTESFSRALLDVAVRESVLQRRSMDYPAKSGGPERLPTFVLNRRLVPNVNIGVKLQGRHEIDLDDVRLAAENPDEFVRKMMKTTTEGDQRRLPL